VVKLNKINLIESLLNVIGEGWYNLAITFAEPWEIPWVVPVGIRDDYEIHFLEKEKGRFFIGGREYSICEGDVLSSVM